MGKAKTKEQFAQELSQVLPDIEVVGDYINTNTKLLNTPEKEAI